MRDRLSQQEQENRKAVEKAKIDVREQIEQAVQNEKKIWEKEQKYAENEQLKQYRLISYESIITPHDHRGYKLIIFYFFNEGVNMKQDLF